MTWESDAWIKEHMATNAELIEAIDQHWTDPVSRSHTY